MNNQFIISKDSLTAAGSTAVAVLDSLRDIWTRQWELGDEAAFLKLVVEPIVIDWSRDPEAESADEDSASLHAIANAQSMPRLIFQIACIAAVEAIRVQETDATNDHKWACVCEAKGMLGMLLGSMGEIDQISTWAKRGADARHAENRAMKAQLFEWCTAHLSTFKSLDAAAVAVIQTQMPIAFRTARSWIGEWKKLQSAGTL